MSRRPALVVSASLLGAALGALSAPGHAQEAPGTYVYVHAVTSGLRIDAFRLGSDGSLAPVSGSPFQAPGDPGSCEGACNALDWSPQRGVLVSAEDAGVTSWEVGDSGELGVIDGSPFAYQVDQPGTGVAVAEAAGRAFAYSTQFFGGSMDGFEIAADGTLARVAGLPLTGRPGASVVDAGGSHVVFCDEDNRRIAAFAVAADGTLTEVAKSPRKVPGKGGIYWARTTADGTLAFVGDWFGGRSIYSYAFSKKTGAVKSGPKTKLKIKESDGGMSIASNGLAAVFAGEGENDVQIFSVKPSGKLKRRGKPQATGLGKVYVHAFSPDGAYLIAASHADGRVRSFAVDALTGELTLVDEEQVGTAAAFNGIAVVTR